MTPSMRYYRKQIALQGQAYRDEANARRRRQRAALSPEARRTRRAAWDRATKLRRILGREAAA